MNFIYILKKYMLVVGPKSSPHDLGWLGYTRVTMVKTNSYDKAIWSFCKNYRVRIRL